MRTYPMELLPSSAGPPAPPESCAVMPTFAAWSQVRNASWIAWIAPFAGSSGILAALMLRVSAVGLKPRSLWPP
jgi:hypothetical protein